MHVRILETIEQCTAIVDDWNRLLRPLAQTIDGIDHTSTFEWILSLWENHLESRPQKIFVLEDAGEVCAILPCHQKLVTNHGVPERRLEPINEIYSSRTGFLLKNAAPQYLEALLDFLYRDHPGWDTFHCHLVDGSSSAASFQKTVATRGYPLRILQHHASPYIALPGDAEAYFSSLSSNFRHNLKQGERKLAKSGTIEIRHFETPEEVDAFIDCVVAVERCSWKRAAGTSITENPLQDSFYRSYIPRAARNGWLLGTVLLLDDRPVAHVIGFVFQNILYLEKTSYDESIRAGGPGKHIHKKLFEHSHRRGIRTIDFMGFCDAAKMDWTDQTYSTTSYVLYNRSFRGSLLRAKHGLTESIRRACRRSSEKSTAKLPDIN